MTWHFPDGVIQGNSQKKLERWLCMLLCSPLCTRLFSYSKRNLRKLLLQLWAVLIQFWVNFFPCLFLSSNPRCATFQSHTCRDRHFVIDKTFAQRRRLFFCSCQLRCSRAECVLLPCCFDLAVCVSCGKWWESYVPLVIYTKVTHKKCSPQL